MTFASELLRLNAEAADGCERQEWSAVDEGAPQGGRKLGVRCACGGWVVSCDPKTAALIVFLRNHAERIAALPECLADLMEEFEQIRADFDRLKRTYEPPYVAYASWAMPGARAALAALESPGGDRG